MAIFKKKKQKIGKVVMPGELLQPELPETKEEIKKVEVKPEPVAPAPSQPVAEPTVPVNETKEKKVARIMAAQVTEDGKILFTILADDNSIGSVGDIISLEEEE